MERTQNRIAVQYNGEYAEEGEEWPPAETFSSEPEQEAPSAAPLQQASSSSRTSLSRPAGAVRQTHSAQEVTSCPLHAYPLFLQFLQPQALPFPLQCSAGLLAGNPCSYPPLSSAANSF